MSDLIKLYNPYDFANPVSDENLFAGRKSELEEIIYYLDYAVSSPRPINLAILGPRASGKTSLLNMCELKAKERGFCTVRIDLDENDAQNELNFFNKLFDGILSAAIDFGIYGGPEGKTYDIYLDIISTLNIPDDKTFCPFLFPLQYARSMSAKNTNAPISDYNYKKDLIKIRNEVGKPIVILFDESNVLASNRTHLQKIRNIFMNTPGFMLVFTGTPDLFPVMDDVFSPIIRQFKKILIKEYTSILETQRCITQPLKKLGLSDNTEMFALDVMRSKEIHDLSGGRPYEIQLICHVLFRRVQSKRSKSMELNLAAMEDIRKELETSQDITTRPISSKVRRLRKRQLAAFALLGAYEGSFEDIWSMEYILHGLTRWTKDALKKDLDSLVDEGFFKFEDNIVKFSGDDFDRIYCKYFAKEQDINFKIEPSLEYYWLSYLSSLIDADDDLEEVFVRSSISDATLESILEKMADADSVEDIFGENPFIVTEELYRLLIEFKDQESIPIANVKLSFRESSFYWWCAATKVSSVTKLDKLLRSLDACRNHAEELGLALELKMKLIKPVPQSLLIKKVRLSDDEEAKEMLTFFHAGEALDAYIERHNLENALFHIETVFEYDAHTKDPNWYNSYGYLSFVAGRFESAQGYFKKAIEYNKRNIELPLPTYNLGVVEARLGNFEKAIAHFDESAKLLELINPDDREEVACVFLPTIVETQISFKEIWNLDLLQTARIAKDTCEHWSKLNTK